jgi:hypothetical protein
VCAADERRDVWHPGDLLVNSGASQMNDEGTLRKRAREVIQAGKLPNRRPDRTWGGPGVGADCMICRVPVQRDEVEVELEFARNEKEPSFDRYHAHVRCFAAWESERATSPVTACDRGPWPDGWRVGGVTPVRCAGAAVS